jgi:hypothetical protein
MPAQVDNLVPERLKPQDGAAGDVIDVGKAARLFAISV